MPRCALGVAAVIVFSSLGSVSLAQIDPHLDRQQLPKGCPSCHKGHGVSGSPMLPTPQVELCNSCHDSGARTEQLKTRGKLGQNASPISLATAVRQPFTHPLSDTSFSRHEPGMVVCTSCHSPHRTSVRIATTPSGPASPTRKLSTRKLSTRDPQAFEFELCQGCHGNQGARTQDLLDISRMTSPSNASFHPIEASTLERSPSVNPGLAGSEVNCSDCHGNNDPSGARGPHGSGIRFLLVNQYVTSDGAFDTGQAHALCYECHLQEAVLDSPLFPLHRLHVDGSGASCASCHNPHGSVENRALIRFGEETNVSNVSPSASTGILMFDSLVPGSGSCYLTCHGKDHAGTGYGGAGSGELEQQVAPFLELGPTAAPGVAVRGGRPVKPPKKKIPPL